MKANCVFVFPEASQEFICSLNHHFSVIDPGRLPLSYNIIASQHKPKKLSEFIYSRPERSSFGLCWHGRDMDIIQTSDYINNMQRERKFLVATIGNAFEAQNQAAVKKELLNKYAAAIDQVSTHFVVYYFERWYSFCIFHYTMKVSYRFAGSLCHVEFWSLTILYVLHDYHTCYGNVFQVSFDSSETRSPTPTCNLRRLSRDG